MPTIKHIQKINELYYSFKKNYDTFKKIYHNHKMITQKIILSQGILDQAFLLIKDIESEVESKKEFNRIIKIIKGKND